MVSSDEPSTSPPTKASLKQWWRGFTFPQKLKRDSTTQDKPPSVVFGVPLRQSLRYANVQISTANTNGGDLYIYGYVPVVVAKCGLYLKENATEIEGTFRVSGSAKRMRELQTVFETPPRYGKNLDWKKEYYTTHDAASVFRRYLTQMPEPVIPHNLYHNFRDAYAKQPFNEDEVISTFHALIRSMPRANQYLLLYVLDLLSVFARKSDKNLMTAANLAVIFRPGIISHPDQELSPEQHKLSQQVLEFLIEHQDWFMLDIPPPPRNDSILVPHDSQGAGPSSSITRDQEEVYILPSESDDDAPVGGWKLVDRTKQPNVHFPEDQPLLSADPAAVQGATGVKRSVTVPSRRGNAGDEDRPSHRLIRKKRPESTERNGARLPEHQPPSVTTTPNEASSGVKRSRSMQIRFRTAPAVAAPG